MPVSYLAIWIISLLSIALMLLRFRNIPEVWWICGGAAVLTATRLIPVRLVGHAIAEGTDVYLFLTGMMLLSELAKTHGVFEWLATVAVRMSNGSRVRLFALIYGAGTIVTIFMSNDATAVVLTPAVLAAVKKSKADPLPYLFICAFIANAASFVLPISNPANLVVFHQGIPPLWQWLHAFLLPSLFSIAATYTTLVLYCRRQLKGEVATSIADGHLSHAGKLALSGLVVVAAVLLLASAMGWDLGLPTCVAASVVTLIISIREHTNPEGMLKQISWSVLPLVAGLFVLVEAVNGAGAIHLSQGALHALQNWHPFRAAMTASFSVGIGTNLINNLPLGLIAGASLRAAHVTGVLRNAILVGVDLGPNLSVTGSLATILWLIAIRKEGLNVSAWKFLKAGMVVMPPALAVATLAMVLMGPS